MRIQFFLLSLMLLFCQQCTSSSSELKLTVAFCPTPFSGLGAVVDVDLSTGEWSIDGYFKLSSDLLCPLLIEPTVTFDMLSGDLFMDFTDDFGLVQEVHIPNATADDPVHPKDAFFVGFENMAYARRDKRYVIGASPIVREFGMCNDGCYTFGELDPITGFYQDLQDLPFKDSMDDSHFWDPVTGTYWGQFGYDLRSEQERCADFEAQLCLCSIDGATGTLLSSKLTNFTVYKFARRRSEDGTVLAWINGDLQSCHHLEDNFMFANVHLEDASYDPVVCVDDITIDMDEWIASFSPDLSYFSTGSGNTEGEAQLLVLDTTTGSVLLNSDLKGLGKALHAYMEMFEIWSVDFIVTPE